MARSSGFLPSSGWCLHCWSPSHAWGREDVKCRAGTILWAIVSSATCCPSDGFLLFFLSYHITSPFTVFLPFCSWEVFQTYCFSHSCQALVADCTHRYVGVYVRETAEMLECSHSDSEKEVLCRPCLTPWLTLAHERSSVFPELKGPLEHLVNLKFRLAVRAFRGCPLPFPSRCLWEGKTTSSSHPAGTAPCLSALLVYRLPLNPAGLFWVAASAPMPLLPTHPWSCNSEFAFWAPAGPGGPSLLTWPHLRPHWPSTSSKCQLLPPSGHLTSHSGHPVGPWLSILSLSLSLAKYRWEFLDINTMCEQPCSGAVSLDLSLPEHPTCHIYLLGLPHGGTGAAWGGLLWNSKQEVRWILLCVQLLLLPLPQSFSLFHALPWAKAHRHWTLRQVLLPRFILSGTPHFLPGRTLLSLSAAGNCSTSHLSSFLPQGLLVLGVSILLPVLSGSTPLVLTTTMERKCGKGKFVLIEEGNYTWNIDKMLSLFYIIAAAYIIGMKNGPPLFLPFLLSKTLPIYHIT